MARNLNQLEKDKIVDLYISGCSYSEITKITKASASTISSLVKGIRSHSDSVKLSFKRNGKNISNEARSKMIEAGKKSCLNQKKYWTKPEQEFCAILREIGLGVVFPELIVDEIKQSSDADGEIYFQYPIQRYVCDFVDVQNKIVFRIHGDFWHANPILYDQNKLTEIQKHNIKQDKNAKTFLEKNDWKVVDIWESEIKWNKPLVIDKIRAMRKMANPSRLHREDTGIVTQIAHYEWSEQLKNLWFKEPKQIVKTKLVCNFCKNDFYVSAKNKRAKKKKYCSVNCRQHGSRKVDRPSKETLMEELKTMSFSACGRKYGVSDKAIRKWIK